MIIILSENGQGLRNGLLHRLLARFLNRYLPLAVMFGDYSAVQAAC